MIQSTTKQLSILYFTHKLLYPYHVRGVDGSGTEHLTVESYTVVHAANSPTYYYY